MVLRVYCYHPPTFSKTTVNILWVINVALWMIKLPLLHEAIYKICWVKCNNNCPSKLSQYLQAQNYKALTWAILKNMQKPGKFVHLLIVVDDCRHQGTVLLVRVAVFANICQSIIQSRLSIKLLTPLSVPYVWHGHNATSLQLQECNTVISPSLFPAWGDVQIVDIDFNIIYFSQLFSVSVVSWKVTTALNVTNHNSDRQLWY